MSVTDRAARPAEGADSNPLLEAALQAHLGEHARLDARHCNPSCLAEMFLRGQVAAMAIPEGAGNASYRKAAKALTEQLLDAAESNARTVTLTGYDGSMLLQMARLVLEPAHRTVPKALAEAERRIAIRREIEAEFMAEIAQEASEWIGLAMLSTTPEGHYVMDRERFGALIGWLHEGGARPAPAAAPREGGALPLTDAEGADAEMWAALSVVRGRLPNYPAAGFASGFVEGWRLARAAAPVVGGGDARALLECIRELRTAAYGNAHGCAEQDRIFEMAQRALGRYESAAARAAARGGVSMAGLCERCMEREARSPHDLFCDECETPMSARETHQDANLTPAPAGVAPVPTVDAAAVLAAMERLENEVAVWRDLAEANMGPDQPDLIRDLALVLPLAREVIALRGRAERAERRSADLEAHDSDGWAVATFNAAEAKRYFERVALLVGLLRAVEWGGYLESTVTGLPPARYCQFCYGPVTKGHGPDCRFVAALADGG